MAANDSYAELASSCIHWGEGTSSVNETESAWLSRSYTIYGALLRLRMLPLASQTRRKDQRSDSQADGCHPELVSATPGQGCGAMLSVQVLGADGREGNTPGATAAVFEPLCGMVHRHGIVHLELLLVGPHVDPSLDATRHSGLCGGTEQAELTVIYSTSMYHKLEDRVRRGSAATFCFNAGVWGYESWIPTIAAACDADCAVVITSYNSHEAADDKDALEDAEEEGLLQPAVAGLRWVWEPEKNPFRSRCQRESSTVPGRMLADNHHWQCVASSK